ncbi:hypothetical protein VTK56DRAFT_10016 [Thermocarpiscus australiensis]
MSVVGKRKTHAAGSGRMPAIVISRKAIDPTKAPPRASPRRPGRRKKWERSEQQEARDGLEEEGDMKNVTRVSLSAAASGNRLPSSTFAVEIPVNRTKPGSGRDTQMAALGSPPRQSKSGTQQNLSTSALWQYLTVYMPHDTPLPESPPVIELLPLPLARELPDRWKSQLAAGYPNAKALCALLVYLSGTRNSLPCAVCAGTGTWSAVNMIAAITPFPECVTLPAAASAELKEYFGAKRCCNSFYRSESQGKGVESVSGLFSPLPNSNGIVPTDNKTVEEETAKPAPSTPKGHNGGTGKPGITVERNGTRRSSRRLLEKQQQEEQEQESKRGAASKSTDSRSDNYPPSSPKLKRREAGDARASSPAPNKTDRDAEKADSRLKAPPGTVPTLSLMMADWEIAPGRIRVGTGDTVESPFSLLPLDLSSPLLVLPQLPYPSEAVKKK